MSVETARPEPSIEPLQSAWHSAAQTFVGADPGRSVLLRGAGLEASVGADEPLPGASLLKIPLAIAAFEADRSGRIDLGADVALADVRRSRWPSVLDVFTAGRALTLLELLGITLATSDNRSADYLVTTLGLDLVNQVARHLGCTGTELRVGFHDDVLNHRGRANVTTARDCANLLHAVSRRPEWAPITSALATNLSNTRIPLRLPDEIVVAHKTGTLEGVVNDVGIVKAPRGDLIACFLTDGQTDPAATSADIGACALRAFEAWESNELC